MIIGWQPVLGAGSRLSKKRKTDSDDVGISPGELNLVGHSFTTRFLIGTLMKTYYAADPQPLLEFMGEISNFFHRMYNEGIQYRGHTIKWLIIGIKGDLPFISKIAQLRRSYTHTRKRKAHADSKELAGICWLCCCGTSEFPFEGFSKSARWMSTTDLDNICPWNPEQEPSILSGILHDPLRKPDMFKCDLFHILNAGLYKDFCASSLVLLLSAFG